MAQALAAAKAQIAAAQVPIQNQAAQAASANASHGQAIQGFSTALADIQKGIAPQIAQTYGGAADRQAIIAKGFSAGAQAAIQGSANQANDILAKQQGPGGQTVTDNSQAAGDVLYGLGGYIPATDFNREGAAYTAAAQLLPANALRQGQQDYTSNIFAGNADQQGFNNQLAAISASTPAVANDIYASLQDMLFKKQTLADSEKKNAFDEKLDLAKYKTGVDQFNVSTTLDYKRLAQDAFQSDRSYGVQLANLGIAQKKLQLQAIADEAKLKNGGFTPIQVEKFKGTALRLTDNAFNGIQKVDKTTGLPITTKDGKPVWVHPPLNYKGAVREARKEGIPLSIALPALFTKYTPGTRGRPLTKTASDNFDPQFAGAPGNAASILEAGALAKVTESFLGTPYKWGGNTPGKGLDCSAFVQQAMAKLGVKIPRTTQTQVKAGRPVDLNELQPGDAVFTEPGANGPKHVGLYIGGGQVQESPHTGDVNKIIPLQDFLGGGFVAARRYL